MRFSIRFFFSRLLCDSYSVAHIVPPSMGNMKDEQNTVAKRVELKEHGKAINFYIFSVIHLFLPSPPTDDRERHSEFSFSFTPFFPHSSSRVMSFESSSGRREKKRKWNFLPECLSKLILSLFFCSPVPNVSFHVYAESFLAQFFESHAVMLQGNAGLKPKEGELTSQPWMWPINYKVSSARLSHNSPVLCFLFCAASALLNYSCRN